MLQQMRSASAGGEPNKGKLRRCNHTRYLCTVVVTGPENLFSIVERRHSDFAPGLGGRVCFVVGDEDGNRQFLNLFSIIKDSHTIKKYRPARNLKKSPNYQRTSSFFISSPPSCIKLFVAQLFVQVL